MKNCKCKEPELVMQSTAKNLLCKKCGKEKAKDNNYAVRLIPMPGTFVNAFLFLEGEKMPVGFAHLLFIGEYEEKECMLLNIDIIYKFRRMGAATAFLTGIKEECHAITTDYKTTAGKMLCLKNEFKFEGTGKGNKVLVWRKKTNIITKI